MAETTRKFSTDRLEELGIDSDPETILIVNCLLSMSERLLNHSLEDIAARASKIERLQEEYKRVIFAESTCGVAEANPEQGHVCTECTWSVLGSLAVNQADLWLRYESSGFGLGVNYCVAGQIEPIASLEMRILTQEWGEQSVLDAVYGPDNAIFGGLLGNQPLDCVAAAANDAASLAAEGTLL